MTPVNTQTPNILLIYPEIPDTFWSFKHALKFVGKKVSLPPLGLATIAAMLPNNWSLRLVDMNIRGLSMEDLDWADYAFISAMTVQRESSGRVIKRCVEAGLKVVAGGSLFTVEHEDFPEVDYFVLNEAELTLPEFLKDLDQGRPKRIYSTDKYADMGQTPIPRWDLLELKQYATMSVQYSRGCPFNCDFCNITSLLGRTPRSKSAQQKPATYPAHLRKSDGPDSVNYPPGHPGHPGQRAFPLLEAFLLDPVPAPQGHAPGRHPGHLRLPFPEGM